MADLIRSYSSYNSGVGRGYTWGRTRQTVLFNGGNPNSEGGEGSGDVDADSTSSSVQQK